MNKPVKITAGEIEERAFAALKPNPRNSRKHPPEQIETLRASIREYGITRPVLVDEDDVIIAGHGLTLAAIAENVKTGPVIVARGWSDKQKRAYIIMDNKAALGSTWDEDILRSEMTALKSLGFDLALTGFSMAELEPLMFDRSTLGDPDEVPDPPKNPVARAGDLWLLGDHRLLCGDSTNADNVARLLNGAVPHLMVTDPPYGVVYDPNWRNSADRSTKIKGRKIGATAIGKVMNDDRADWRAAWELFPGDVAFVWHAGLHASTVELSLIAADFDIRSQIIWNKQTHIIGRGDYHWKHEPCWYAVRKGRTGHYDRTDRTQNTVWDIAHRASETGHGTQKPVECMRRPIVNNSKAKDGVYDPFLGSGTTMIACQMERRHCFGMELDPAYVDVCITRWQTFAGATATLDGDGRTYADVAKARAKGRRPKGAKP